MTNRQMAIQELFRGLTEKYGSSPACQKTIEAEVKKLSKTKAKISVHDLDMLENSIKRISGYKTPAKFINTQKAVRSTSDQHNTRDYLLNEDSESVLVKNSLMKLNKRTGRKLVPKNPDSILFPSEFSAMNTSYELIDSPEISPIKSKLHDEWGKVVKADHLKYLNEEQLKKIKQKFEQDRYKKALVEQITEAQNLKKKSAEDDKKVTYADDTFKNIPRQSFDEKKWLDEIMQKKRESSELRIRNKKAEQEKLRQQWAVEAEEDIQKKIEQRKLKKMIASFQLVQASAKQKAKHFIKEVDKNYCKSLVEDRIKRMEELEFEKIVHVNKRIQYVHDEERLKKLLPKTSISKYDFSDITDSKLSFYGSQDSESPKLKNQDYIQALKLQIEEHKAREFQKIHINKHEEKLMLESSSRKKTNIF